MTTPQHTHIQPSELGELEELTELWLDSNCLYELPEVRSMYTTCTSYLDEHEQAPH